MPEKWTGNLVGKMHVNGIKAKDLAEQAGVTNAYVSMILNGARSPKGAREMLETALDELIRKRKDGTS